VAHPGILPIILNQCNSTSQIILAEGKIFVASKRQPEQEPVTGRISIVNLNFLYAQPGFCMDNIGNNAIAGSVCFPGGKNSKQWCQRKNQAGYLYRLLDPLSSYCYFIVADAVYQL